MVVGSRHDFFFGFNNMRRNTRRSDFVRYQTNTWKQPWVAFRGQGDAAVRHIASITGTQLWIACGHQGCEPKTESRFFRSVFLGFSRPKTDFLRSVFRLPKKNETEKPTRFCSVVFFPCTLRQ